MRKEEGREPRIKKKKKNARIRKRIRPRKRKGNSVVFGRHLESKLGGATLPVFIPPGSS